MELLLNLIWLLLALPAIWIWRREPCQSSRSIRVHHFLVLGCVLILLFPVVSASDDLNAMRPEMEESSPSKRMVRQAAGEKSPAWSGNGGSIAALVTSSFSFGLSEEARGLVYASAELLLEYPFFSIRTPRAPPFSHLG